jgi:hypothetical protein
MQSKQTVESMWTGALPRSFLRWRKKGDRADMQDDASILGTRHMSYPWIVVANASLTRPVSGSDSLLGPWADAG